MRKRRNVSRRKSNRVWRKGKRTRKKNRIMLPRGGYSL